MDLRLAIDWSLESGLKMTGVRNVAAMVLLASCFPIQLFRPDSSCVADEPAHVQASGADAEDQSRRLREAARTGDVVTVTSLIQNGADVDASDDYGVTALAMAARQGHVDVAQLLLDADADPNRKDSFYKASPLDWAVMEKNATIATLLVKSGSDSLVQAVGLAVSSADADLTRAILDRDDKTDQDVRDFFRKIDQRRQSDEAHQRSAEENDRIAVVMDLVKAARNSLPPVTTPRMAEPVVDDANANQPNPDDDADEHDLESWANLDTHDYPLASKPWNQFRGFMGRGVAPAAELEIDWDLQTGRGVHFQTSLEGLATSSPICIGDRIYLTDAVPVETEGTLDDANGFRIGSYGDVKPVQDVRQWRYEVIAMDATDGKIIWQTVVGQSVPKVARHPKSSFANCTPASDGQTIVAWFGGEGLFALNRDGEVLWNRDLGKLDSGWFYDRSYQWGFGSSPVIADDRVYLQCDVQDQSSVLALDLSTGETLWQTDRDEIPTWSSPVVVPSDENEGDFLVVSGTKSSAAYRCDTGERMWTIGGFSEIMVPTPQVTPQQILLCSGYRPVKPILSLAHSARGTIQLPRQSRYGDDAASQETTSSSGVRWYHERGGPYMPTPVIDRGLVYILANSGILTVLRNDNGQKIYSKRLSGGGGAYCGSPIVMGTVLICVSESGVVSLIRTGPEFELLSQHDLDEAVLSTPAVCGNRLIIRTAKRLWSLGGELAGRSPADQG